MPFGALTFASCSGEEETVDDAATVISAAEAEADAASEITDEKSAEAALDAMLED